VHVVKDEPLDRGTPDEVRRREGARLTEALDGWTPIAFDRTGRAVSSEDLAELVGRCEETPPRRTAFVIGGAEGLDGAVLGACRERLSLGAVTLPHQLARVVAAEQLYRALAIRAGLPYHR
jgi:23S rRNA (pseudouridine1915-N3)-methyltransferase